jgi:hypothetical protein
LYRQTQNFLFSLMYLLAANAARADQLGDERDGGSDIVVTATPLFDPGEDVPGLPAQSFTDEDLTLSRALDATEHLKRMAGGVFVNEVQGNPLQPDLNYRGFTASPLLGTPQGLSVYVDGIRINQPFGDVVSWDLIPKSAIRSLTLIPGSNPLFGRNSLGGALAIATKDGRSDPGFGLEASYGAFDRRIGRASAGGTSDEFHWFAAGDYFAEDGWRDRSPSEAGQGFVKLGWARGGTEAALSVTGADTRLTGNGLQEMRLLAADRRSVYTFPDTTRNRAWLVNLTGRHAASDAVALSGNAFWRSVRTRTLNGDANPAPAVSRRRRARRELQRPAQPLAQPAAGMGSDSRGCDRDTLAHRRNADARRGLCRRARALCPDEPVRFPNRAARRRRRGRRVRRRCGSRSLRPDPCAESLRVERAQDHAQTGPRPVGALRPELDQEPRCDHARRRPGEPGRRSSLQAPQSSDIDALVGDRIDGPRRRAGADQPGAVGDRARLRRPGDAVPPAERAGRRSAARPGRGDHV